MVLLVTFLMGPTLFYCSLQYKIIFYCIEFYISWIKTGIWHKTLCVHMPVLYVLQEEPMTALLGACKFAYSK